MAGHVYNLSPEWLIEFCDIVCSPEWLDLATCPPEWLESDTRMAAGILCLSEMSSLCVGIYCTVMQFQIYVSLRIHHHDSISWPPVCISLQCHGGLYRLTEDSINLVWWSTDLNCNSIQIFLRRLHWQIFNGDIVVKSWWSDLGWIDAYSTHTMNCLTVDKIHHLVIKFEPATICPNVILMATMSSNHQKWHLLDSWL